MSREALTLAQELSHPYTLAIVLPLFTYAAMFHQFCREPRAVYKRQATAAK